MDQKSYNKYRDIALNIAKDINRAEDLLHESLLVILEYDQDKVKRMEDEGTLSFFISRIMANNYHSKTSKYYYKYKRYYQLFSDLGYGNQSYANKLMIAEHKKQETIEHIKYILEGMYWYDRELIKLYYFGDYDGEKYTLDSLAKKTGISRTSIFHTIREARKYIKSKLDGF